MTRQLKVPAGYSGPPADRTLGRVNASYVLLFLGIMSTFASIAILATSRPLRGGVITTGTVTDNQRESSTIQVRGTGRRMTTYAPVVQYTDQAGVTHHVTPSISG